MRDFLKNKEKQSSVCGFFAMLLAMCVVGSYYLQYSHDLYWVKLLTYAILTLCSGYVFASSLLRKDTVETIAALGLMLVLLFSEIESVFWLTKRADWRKTAEAIALAFKAFGTFTLIDILVFNRAFIKKVPYIVTSAVLLFVTAIVKSLPIIFTSLTTGFLAENISILNTFFYIVVTLYGLSAIVLGIIQIIKKNNKFNIWASMCYSLSVFMLGVFGVLRQLGYDAVQLSKNTAILFEIGSMMLIIAVVNYNQPVKKNNSKQR